MRAKKRDRLIDRGVWLLVVGVFTSWLGIGLIFILAAAACGFVGLFRERVLQSGLLLLSSIALGCVCFVLVLHVAAIAGVYAFRTLPPEKSGSPAAVIPSKARK
jgi:hypothetical protein